MIQKQEKLTKVEIEAMSRAIRQNRESMGLSRGALAAKAGLSVRTIEKIEWGQMTFPPTRITLIKLQRALNLRLLVDYAAPGETDDPVNEEYKEDQMERERLERLWDTPPQSNRESDGNDGNT